MSDQSTRAGRALAGSNRQRDLEAAGMPTRSSTGLGATDRVRASEERSKAKWRRNIERGRELFPDATPDWHPLIAFAIGRCERKRRKRPVTRARVIRILDDNGYPASEGLSE